MVDELSRLRAELRAVHSANARLGGESDFYRSRVDELVAAQTEIERAAREFAATEEIRIDAEGHALYQALRRALTSEEGDKRGGLLPHSGGPSRGSLPPMTCDDMVLS